MARITIETLSFTDYLQAGPSGFDIIPEVPAVYFWTLDFLRLRRLRPNAAVAQALALLENPIRTFDGRANPFYSVAIKDSPLSLGVTKRAKLASILAVNDEFSGWAMSYVTCLQRPLYIGQATNLRARFRTHITSGSIFRGYLDEAELTLRECAFNYIALPSGVTGDLQIAAEADDEGDYVDAGPSSALDVLEALLQRAARPLLGRRLE